MWKKLSDAWESLKDAKSLYNKIKKWLVESGRPILIIGASGTGKSTLGQILTGDHDVLVNPLGDYHLSRGIEKYTLKRGSGVGIIVLPGQEHHHDLTWPATLRELETGGYRGVILLNAYGYHSPGNIGYNQMGVYEQGDKISAFMQKYRANRLEMELMVLKKLAPALAKCPKKIWLLSVVAKQDLWWGGKKQITSVEDYYRTGQYETEIQKIYNAKGGHLFYHEVAFCSLVIRNLVDGDDAILAKNVSGYDQPYSTKSLRELIEAIHQLKGWEEKD